MYVLIYIHSRGCECVYVCVFMCVWVSECVCMCVRVLVCVCMCVCVSKYNLIIICVWMRSQVTPMKYKLDLGHVMWWLCNGMFI